MKLEDLTKAELIEHIKKRYGYSERDIARLIWKRYCAQEKKLLEKCIELNQKSLDEKDLIAKFKIFDESEVFYKKQKKAGERANAIYEKYLS